MLISNRQSYVDAGLKIPVSQSIWAQKYQYKINNMPVDYSISDTWARIAHAMVQCEPQEKHSISSEKFLDCMRDFKLIPAGRILAGCGTKRDITLCNTFVMETIPDSVDGIMDIAKQAALTMKMGGGLGYDFSTIRPKGTYVTGLDCTAAGPIAAMEIFDSVCAMVVSGMGRGAMMATLRCDHPSILEFIIAKDTPGRLQNFNMSVMVTDDFMHAVSSDKEWDLVWQGKTMQRVPARELWEKIMQQTYDGAEPGVLFIDRINDMNPLAYLEEINSTNSCAEQPLPPNGACPLASINLAQLVRDPFTANARLDIEELKYLTGVAVHMLDNVLDISQFANPAQEREVRLKRRVGVGVTAVADALFMLDLKYGSAEAIAAVGKWMRVLQNSAYSASADLAKERGSFPAYDAARHQNQPQITKLDPDVRRKILSHGLRNGALTSVAPTGTISMLAGNVSSGIEPVFADSFSRMITNPDGSKRRMIVRDFALEKFRQAFGELTELPDSFITAQDLEPAAHVATQAAAQEWVDGGISKTINCSKDISFEAFKDVYRMAYDQGCKGCTTYRPNDKMGSVLATTY